MIMAPLQEWRGRCAKETRSSKECKLWLEAQHKGGFWQLITSIFGVLKDPVFVRGAGCHAFQWLAGCKPGEQQFEDDERMAALLGNCSLRTSAA